MTKEATYDDIRQALAETLKKAIDEQIEIEELASPEEIRQGLIETLKDRIEAYKSTLVKMREREIGQELKKNADMGYGAQSMPGPETGGATMKSEALCKECGKTHKGQCMAKKFDVEDDGKGKAFIKPSAKKAEMIKAAGYEGVYKSIAKSDHVGFIKYEKSESGFLIKEMYSPFAGQATPANAGAFDNVKDMLFDTAHPNEALYGAFNQHMGQENAGASVQIPGLGAVAQQKGMNPSAMPNSMQVAYEQVPAQNGFQKSEGMWKGEFTKAEELIDTEHSGDPEKRYVKPGRTGVLPGDKDPKKYQPGREDGSGGKISKGKALDKAAPPMAKPPSGQVPGAKTPVANPGGAAIGAPKSSGALPGAKPPAAPKAPGIKPMGTPAMKAEIPGAAGRAEVAHGALNPKSFKPKVNARMVPAKPMIPNPKISGAAVRAEALHQAPPGSIRKEEIAAGKEVQSNPAKGADGKVFTTPGGSNANGEVDAEHIQAGGAQSTHPAALSGARGAEGSKEDKFGRPGSAAIGKGELSGKKITAPAGTGKAPTEYGAASGAAKSHPPIIPGMKKKEVKEVKSNPAKGADGKVMNTGGEKPAGVHPHYIKAGGGQPSHPPLTGARGSSADRKDSIK